MRRKYLNEKNAFTLAVHIGTSRKRWLLWAMATLVVLWLAVSMAITLWQWAALLLCVALSAAHNAIFANKIKQVHADQTDGIYQLTVNHQGKSQLWQAYLSDVSVSSFGFGRVLLLEFFVILPRQRSLKLVIFDDAIDAASFSQLVVLSRFGGYRGIGEAMMLERQAQAAAKDKIV